MSKNVQILSIAAFIAFCIDQGSKFYVTHYLKLAEGSFVPVIPPFYNMQYLKNHGINFGLFGQGSDFSRWALVLLSTAMVAGVIYWLRDKLNTRIAIFVGLLVGGAVGNIFDRIVFGSVVDFINNSWYTFRNPFSYNIADIWIFFGLIGLLFWGPKDE